MTKLSLLINVIANTQAHASLPEDDMIARLDLVKIIIRQEKEIARQEAIEQAKIGLQRDRLLARISELLGIPPDEYTDFLDQIQ